MAPSGSTSGHDSLVLADSIIAFWVVLWIVLGVLTGYQLWSLSDISAAVAASGRAADQAGRALQLISELPLVPEGPGELGDQVRVAADEASRSAVSIRADLRRLSLLLGVSVAVVPTAPVLALWLPDRLRRRRAVAAVDAELRRSGRTPQLEAYLALMAVSEVGYADLRVVSDDPVGDLLAGRHTALADEQLRRLGLAPGARERPGP
jgi:hypothetical protein